MNTQTQEALHKALKVLNCLNNDRVYETAWVKGAINACEEALAQPAQEPVAWMDEEGIWQYEWESHSDNKKPLYTHPAPSWQGLSDDEIDALTKDYDWQPYPNLIEIAHVIEQALKEKNT